MKILFILPFHNASAALFENGQCLSYLHEEKFNNIKNYWGYPKLCLEYLEKQFGLSNLDRIVFSSTQLFIDNLPAKNNLIHKTEKLLTGNLKEKLLNLEYYLPVPHIFSKIRNIILDRLISPYARKQMSNYLSEKYNVPTSHVLFFDHHRTHAYSPIHFYNLHLQSQPYLIFTMDGSGDNYSAKIFVYQPSKSLKEIAKTPFYSSIGLLYSGLTRHFGMKPGEHEYKVMGLAAYVTDSKYYQTVIEKLKKLVSLDKKTLTFQSNKNLNHSHIFFRSNFPEIRFDNLAAGVQEYTESLTIEWIQSAIKKYKIHNVAFSGGVFMNVKLNKKIQELETVKKAFFMPSSGDDSLGYGAVFQATKKGGFKSASSMYLGLNYSSTDVSDYIKVNNLVKKFKISTIDNPPLTVAKLVSENNIVAWFYGKGEWGARSLCHRTILTNSSDYSNYHQVNDAIKMRDFWMPFAPTILEEWAEKYILNWKTLRPKILNSSKYMITAFDTTPLAQKHLMASMHQRDKTIRPQLVTSKDDEYLYQMLKHYEKFTGMGGLMNTSLNIHGYPLVGSIQQAIFTLENSHLNNLIIENFLIQKK